MKIKQIIAMSVLLIMPFGLKAQNYAKLWKEIETYRQKDQPQSAIKSAKLIYDKATKNGDEGWRMKSLLTMMQMRNEISSDSLQVDLKRLMQMARDTKDVAMRSVIESALASYLSEANTRVGDNEAEMTELPDDMDEWSSAQYRTQAQRYFLSSVENMELLSKTKAADFVPFVQEGKDSRWFNDDLLSILGKRAAQALPDSARANVYRRMIDVYRAQGNRPALLLLTLDTLNRNNDDNPYIDTDPNTLDDENATELSEDEVKQLSEHCRTLINLTNEYADLPLCVEAYIALTQSKALSDTKRMAWAQKGIARYPKEERTQELRNYIANETAPNFEFSVNQSLYPGKPRKVECRYRNMAEIEIKLYKVKATSPKDYFDLSDQEADVVFKNLRGDLVQTFHQTLPKGPAYRQLTKSFEFSVSDPGAYVAQIMGTPNDGSPEKTTNPEYIVIYASRLRIIAQYTKKDMRELTVVDGWSGQIMPKALITTFTWDGYNNRENAKATELVTDDNGRALVNVPKQFRNMSLVASTDDECTAAWQNSYSSFFSGGTDDKRTNVNIFTDRGIYRPGQTVHASAFVFTQEGDVTTVVEGKQSTMKLRDANGKEVASQKVTTDEYGTVAADFTLPRQALSGWFILQMDNSSVSFKVEEYKRPTFEVLPDTVKASYTVGDTVMVSGRARTYSGAPVIGAKVAYKVSTRLTFFWFNNPSSDTRSGETLTDGEGRFTFPVVIKGKADKQAGNEWWRGSFFMRNDVNIEVTSTGGETQQAQLSLPCGKPALRLTTNMEKYLDKEAPAAVRYELRNLSGAAMDGQGEYVVYSKNKEVAREKFYANRTFTPKALYALSTGQYEVVATMPNMDADTCRTQVLLCSMKATRPAADVPLWAFVKNTVYSEGHPAQLQIGSALKNATLFYHRYNEGRCVENRIFALSDSVVNFNFDTSNGKGSFVSFALVSEDEIHTYETTLTLAEPQKQLQMKWTTFRDKLRPGQQETWLMQILGPDNRPAKAQLMAAMYDASLNKFTANDWNFNLSFNHSIFCTVSRPNFFNLNDENVNGNISLSLPDVRSFAFSHLDESLLNSYSRYFVAENIMLGAAPRTRRLNEMVVGYGRKAKSRGMAASDMPMAMDEANGLVGRIAGLDTPKTMAASKNTDEQPATIGAAPKSLRTNLTETAFFYPQLQTDPSGNVCIKFTLPESLTTWRFKGLAHTKDMNYGLMESDVVASKDFMVQPNLPRFVRVGDRTTLNATVFNLTDKPLKSTVTCELYDPETERVVSSQKVKATAEGNASQTVSFSFVPTDEYPLLACRIVGDAGQFSDGEQNYLPVLTDRELVTQTVPFVLTKGGTTNISLASLSSLTKGDSQLKKVAVEIANNPIWYAIQALPDIATPQNECAYSWAAAYYANTLAAHIANSAPRIRQVIEAWQREGGTSQTLWSNVQKNEDLKQILLQETPWVMEAESEQAQKERLSALFDINAVGQKQSQCLAKLKELQSANGAFCWFKGMFEDRWMTASIAELLVRLDALVAEDADREAVLKKALSYLHSQETDDVKELKKCEKKGEKVSIPAFDIHLLYINALSDNPLNARTQEAENYLLRLLEKETVSLTMYGKARAIVIWHHNQREDLAAENLKSMLEHTVKTEALGRYFDNQSSRMFWIDEKIPSQTAAIEALLLSKSNQVQTISEMRQWLLSTKRVRSWRTAVDNVNATYALLVDNMKMLDARPDAKLTLQYAKKSELAVCTPQTAEQKTTAGLGYYRETLPKERLTELPSSLLVTKADDQTSWGAVYAQAMQPLTQIEASRSGLKVTREYLVEEQRATDKPLLRPLNGNLKVGDKLVVRVVLSADQTYDYVQLRDERPACCEPAETASGYHWQSGAGYYQVVHDASTDYFFDHLYKGTYVFEQRLYVERPGTYQSGMANVQCAYAPEFAGHTAAVRLTVEK